MSNENNRAVYQLVDTLLAAAGFQPDSSVRHNLSTLDFHVGDAEIARLRAELAERDAEVARLREANSAFASAAIRKDEQPRTDAEWVAADRKKRINDLAARYAGEMAGVYLDAFWTEECGWRSLVLHSRALAEQVVEAEE